MFAKVFTQILDSSIAEDYQVRHIFEDMLKLCDINGVVDMTHEAIARRLNVPLEIVQRCISELEKPDPKSRTPEHEGRRLARLDEHRDWGWLIPNYEYYRKLASEEQRREKTAARTRKWREKSELESVTHSDASDAMQKQKQKQKQREVQTPGVGLPAEAVFWNENCGNLPKVASVGASRMRHLQARRKDPFWVKHYEEAVKKVVGSDFCNGKGGRGWLASFDWIIERPNSVAKTMEGQYDNRTPQKPPTNPVADRIALEQELQRLTAELETLNNAMQYDWDRTPVRVARRKWVKERIGKINELLSSTSAAATA